MAFRNYEKTKSCCIETTSPSDLEKAVDDIQERYDIIDLQFSTHYAGQTKFCVFLLLAQKGELNGK